MSVEITTAKIELLAAWALRMPRPLEIDREMHFALLALAADRDRLAAVVASLRCGPFGEDEDGFSVEWAVGDRTHSLVIDVGKAEYLVFENCKVVERKSWPDALAATKSAEDEREGR